MISAIVLAAGLSIRMGEQNKLLLDYRGKPLIRHVVSRILSSAVGEVIVVLGHESNDVMKTLEGLAVIFVRNQDYALGMTSSIQAGVSIARGSAYMICLSDMYAITSSEYNSLISFFENNRISDPDAICIPVFHGSKGNPVTFSSQYRDQILSHPDPEGCRQIVRQHQQHLYQLNMPDAHILQDLDYPEDYRRISEYGG